MGKQGHSQVRIGEIIKGVYYPESRRTSPLPAKPYYPSNRQAFVLCNDVLESTWSAVSLETRTD